MEILVSIAVIVAWVLVWRWVAKRMGRAGRGVFLRHIAGSSAGTVAAVFVMALLGGVAGDPTPDKPMEPTPVVASAPPLQMQALPAFTVVSDEYMASFKRTVEISLPARISTADLSAIAEAIKANATRTTDRTFIGYRIAGEPESGYWATTHYDPGLEVRVLENF